MRELVGQYESSGRLVHIYTIIRIANALNVHSDRLLAWKQED